MIQYRLGALDPCKFGYCMALARLLMALFTSFFVQRCCDRALLLHYPSSAVCRSVVLRWMMFFKFFLINIKRTLRPFTIRPEFRPGKHEKFALKMDILGQLHLCPRSTSGCHLCTKT